MQLWQTVRVYFCVLVTLASTLGLAETKASGQTTSNSDDQMGEIVVTARKRAESIQTVPASIQALSSEEIARLGVTSLNDLATAIPGINLSTYQPGMAVISMRGVSSSSPSPTVGFYLDDVAISSRMSDSTTFSGQSVPAMLDVERVEVLKGPQGTLYGASSMGGAIKFVSTQPSKDGLSVDVSGDTAAMAGGAESYSGQFIANIPLIDNTLALRIGSLYDFQGGFVDRVPRGLALNTASPNGQFLSFNSTYDSNVNSHQTVATRIALGFWPNDSLSVVLDLRYQELRSPDLDSFWPNLPKFQQSDVLPQPISDVLAVPMLTIVKHMGALDLTSVTAEVDRRRYQTFDYTFWSGALVPAWANLPSESVDLTPIKTLSQEIRVATANPAARTQIVAGVYWQRERMDWLQNIYSYGSGVSSPGVPENETYVGSFDSVVKQAAAFADITYSVTDAIDLIAGGREFHFQEYFNPTQNGYFNGGFSTAQSSSSESGFTPKFEVTGKLSRDHLIYALVDKGFRPGENNFPIPTSLCAGDLATLGLTSAPNSYKSDSLWNYEIGTKNTFPEQRATLNSSLFYLDWSNIQQTVVLPTCGFTYTANVGAAAVKGAEFEGRWSPASGLTLSASGTYADAYITKSAPGTQGQVGDPVEVSPKWVVNGSLEYNFNFLRAWPSFARVDYQWHGSQTQNFIRTITTDADPSTGASFGGQRTIANPAYLQQPYNQVNASMGIKFPSWSARIYVDNITDQQPLLNLTNFASGGLQTTAYTLTPRTIGVSLSKSFH